MTSPGVQRAFFALGAEAAAIDKAALRLAPQVAAIESALRHLFAETVVTTGMGKAGIVAQKFAATLRSLGRPAHYVHPGEAAHGDLGALIGDEVAVFAFSTSGETLEVVDLLVAATARLRCTATVLLTCRANSSAGRIASTVLDLGELEEADALKLAPTCSTTALLAVSDALACAYAVEAGLTREQFGRLHHAGYLGSVALGDG